MSVEATTVAPIVVSRWRTAAAGLLIAAAGGLLWWGLALRWSPCTGDFDFAACMTVQSDPHTSFLPTEPWVPIPGVTELGGWALLLVAAGLGVGASPYLTRRPVRMLWWFLLAVLALVGGLDLRSGLTGTTVSSQIYFLWMGVGLLALGLAVAILVGHAEDRAAWQLAAVLAVVALHNSIFEYLVSNVAYGSHDTAPWTGSLSASLFAGIGLALVVTAARPPPSPAA